MRGPHRAIPKGEVWRLLAHALRRDRSRRPARAQDQHTKAPEGSTERFLHRARNSRAVGVKSATPRFAEHDRIQRADARRGFVQITDEREGRDLVRHGQIHADKIEPGHALQGVPELRRRDLKSRITHRHLKTTQRGVVHLWRARMHNRIADDPEPDWQVEFARDRTPILQIVECVKMFHAWNSPHSVAVSPPLLMSRFHEHAERDPSPRAD